MGENPRVCASKKAGNGFGFLAGVTLANDRPTIAAPAMDENAMVKPATVIAARFGYGLPLPAGAPTDAEAILQRLAGPDLMAEAWPIFSQQEMVLATEAVAKTNKLPKTIENAALRKASREAVTVLERAAEKASFARAIESPDGFRERLVAFWVDHFSVAFPNGPRALLPFRMVEEAIRPNLNRDFTSLLTAVTLHPAMLTYLNQLESIGPNSPRGRKQGKGLNENLAREVLELHSLGVGGPYSQTDVTEMAKLLTGITFDLEKGVGFAPQRAEPGAETILGESYGGAGFAPINRALSDLARRPETAKHIARKLAAHFVSDTPDPYFLQAIAAAFAESGGDLMATYRVLLQHPAALAPETPKVRQPFDFLIAGSRALAVKGEDLVAMPDRRFSRFYLEPMRRMGQDFRSPDGPNGFPEAAEAWITPAGLAERISWAMTVPARLLRKTPDPVSFAETCLDDRASADLLWSVARAEDRDQAVGLVLASVEFNRR